MSLAIIISNARAIWIPKCSSMFKAYWCLSVNPNCVSKSRKRITIYIGKWIRKLFAHHKDIKFVSLCPAQKKTIHDFISFKICICSQVQFALFNMYQYFTFDLDKWFCIHRLTHEYQCCYFESVFQSSTSI